MARPFVCSACEVMISSEEYLLHWEPVLIFSVASNVLQLGDQVNCAGDLQWHLQQSAVHIKELAPASVKIYSLKAQDLPAVADLFASLPVAASTHVLLKSQLRGYVFNTSADLVVLHHRAEGRLFLTDRNGFYNDFLASAYRAVKGRVLVILSGVVSDPPEGALVSSEVYELAKNGDQPTIGVLGQLGKVMCYTSEPSEYQRSYLASLVERSAYFRDPPVYTGLPPAYSNDLPAGAFKCDLL